MKSFKIFNKEYAPSHVRVIEEMKNAIYDQEWAGSQNPEKPLYYMFRGVYKNDSDKKIALENNFRHDITIIPSGNIGKEFIKTQGHYHEKIPGTNLTYPELYEVLQGEAYFLIQEEIADGGTVKEVFAVKCSQGDKIIIPPNYGHFTINAGKKDLILGNLVSNKFKSLYAEILKKRGASYLALDDNGKIKWVKNLEYKKLPELKMKKPSFAPELGITKEKPIYDIIQKPSLLNFLNKPQEYLNIWKLKTN